MSFIMCVDAESVCWCIYQCVSVCQMLQMLQHQKSLENTNDYLKFHRFHRFETGLINIYITLKFSVRWMQNWNSFGLGFSVVWNYKDTVALFSSTLSISLSHSFAVVLYCPIQSMVRCITLNPSKNDERAVRAGHAYYWGSTGIA